MYPLFVNISLYAIFAYYLRTHYRADISIMIMPYMYLITAIISVFCYCSDPQEYHLNYGGFFYLFFVFAVSVIPLFKFSFHSEDVIRLRRVRIVKILSIVYCLSALIVLTLVVPKSIAAFQFGDWLAIRNEMYWGEIETYNTFGERLAINLSGYLRFFSIFYFFYLLSKIHIIKYKLLVYFLGLLAFLPTFLTAISLAARGTLFQLFYEFLICYLTFRKQIDKSIVRYLRIVALCVLTIAFILTIAITISRFDTDSSNSVLYYLGHSMMTFDYGVYDTTHSCSLGKWLLGDYSSYFTGDNSEFILSKYGAHCGSAFITVFGSLYIDFGFWGTIVFVFLFNIIESNSLGKKNTNNDFGKIFLYAYLSSFFLGGIFVYPETFGIKVLFAFFLYLITSKSCISKC